MQGKREVEEMVRVRGKPTSCVRLLLWAAIRDRTRGRDEPVVALRPLAELRHPDGVARRAKLEPGGRTWLEQDRWASPWWRSVFG